MLIWSLLNFTGITLEGIARAVGRSQRWESSHPTQQLRVVVSGGARWNRGGCLPRCLEDCTRCLPPPCSSCPAFPTSTSSVALRLYLDVYIITSNHFVGARKWPKNARPWKKRNDGRTEVGYFWNIGRANYPVLKHMAKNEKPSLYHHQILKNSWFVLVFPALGECISYPSSWGLRQ